ncbi:hypothetical protein F4824DRAFT_489579 [Ustulina deusta]|nr:hypothetical protein F4824DRAFT_489579 [Ustulina deusta]
MAESAPTLPTMEYDEIVGISQQTATPEGVITLKTNPRVNGKAPHEGLTDGGFPGDHDDHGQDEFPPIETLWAQILEEKKQGRLRSTSPTVMNSPTRYEEYLRQDMHLDALDPRDSIYYETSSGAGVRRHSRKGKNRNNKHRQALRRSERIKALKTKSSKTPK